jgi:hypothetical protein
MARTKKGRRTTGHDAVATIRLSYELRESVDATNENPARVRGSGRAGGSTGPLAIRMTWTALTITSRATALAFGALGHILHPCVLLGAKHIINRGQKREVRYADRFSTPGSSL